MKTERRVLPAPAKINLFLHVLGRRADGYHELETLFTFLTLHDEIELAVDSSGEINQLWPVPGLPAEEDLCIRAAKLLKETTGCRLGAKIGVTKRIPMGGGLGGGSSDAATVLLGLNALWDLRLGRDDLKRLGLSLGADIPVFLGGESAWAEGVGEKLTPFPVPEAWYVVITPPVAVSTALVFSAPELTRNTPRTTMSGFSVGVGRNDLEPVVMARFPEVKEALMWLRRFGDARMSGSGSSVFVPLLSEEEALACFEARPSGWTGFIAQGVQDHPLKNWP